MRLPNPVLLLSLLAVLVTACAPVTTPTSGLSDSEILPENLATEEIAEEYLARAQLKQNNERDTLLAKSAQAYINTGKYDKADIILKMINLKTASRENQRNIQILSARIALGHGNPREALKLLTFEDILPDKQQLYVYKYRSQAFIEAGYPLEAAKTRVQMDQLLEDPVIKDKNHQIIWQSLSLLPETTLRQLNQSPLNKQFLGWLELASISKQAQIDWQFLQDNIKKWREKYPDHPAKVFSEKLWQKQIELIKQPLHIAILLPLTGRYTPITNAIRDGFLTAHLQSNNQTRPKLTFIDTNSQTDKIWNLYQEAVENGADFIVGPFLKPAVNSLAKTDELPVPTLTLNYVESQTEVTQGLFQIGLLPEDEARQSAEMAYRQGHRHAAILVPQGQWGLRLSNAFQQRFEELGGVAISKQNYISGKHDFKQPIQILLNIDQSYARHRKIQSIVNNELKFMPYRRQDVDMIFMAATPKDARQLKPQFKFHYAGELPVYSTSHAFTGKINTRADRDIDDLLYCDMPWILQPSRPLFNALKLKWPEHQPYTRFFALGADTYHIISNLKQLQSQPYERFSGQTGNIYIDPFNRLRRELLWAQFVKGRPVVFDFNAFNQDTPANGSKIN
ncbi:MAG: penicillin-binding protein activator [Gammaproteobacteria bacterium]|nr:penicillin-binding protein activator [Gammaproteobacteria bacterium]